MTKEELKFTNTVFLMYVVTDSYCKAHNMSTKDFLKLDEKHGIIHLVAKCPSIFDSMTDDEMVEEIDGYVARA